MFDFSLSPELEDLRARTLAFVRDAIIPEEHNVDAHSGLAPERLNGLREQARAAGLYAPHVAREWGGLGLNMREMAVVFEAAGRSLIGPAALNCSAPDEGNMHLLELVANSSQQERYLRPLVEGRIRSCFAMTEPPPGAGADPNMLQTSAERDVDGWIITGRKWYITGADGAAFAICMARTGAGPDGRPQATMFLVDAGTPGYTVVRQIPSLDTGSPGGHCEVEFQHCRVGPEAVLGDVGQGFAYAQARLAPARLTHCMRWLGIASRALDIAADYATGRTSFGATLGQHQMVQEMLADSATEIHAARLMIWHAAWVIDQGRPNAEARHATSMTKVYVSEVVNKVVDRAIQITGSHGISGDLPLALFYRNVRPFRIYDGPSEVHRVVIARTVLKEARTRAESGATEGERE